jgi:hypothetical protein
MEIKPGRCRVLFRDDTTSESRGVEMDTATYRLIPLLTPAEPMAYVLAAILGALRGSL